jgi:Protein of unknown function (DUF2408)
LTPDAIVRSLQQSLAVLSVELVPIHERLVNIRRQLVALAAKEGSHKAELKPLQEELRKIDSLSTCFAREVCWFCLPPEGICFDTELTALIYMPKRLCWFLVMNLIQKTGER